MMKIGIYGGSFSPPHMGHVKLAKSFLDTVRLDRLLVVPAGNPPHKKIDGGTDGEVRLEMCKAAFLPLSEKIEVSDFEAFRTDPCYTVDTLRHFFSEGELYMLCGSDMFLTLEDWHSPDEIFRLATIVCGTRVDDPVTMTELRTASERYSCKYGAKTKVMEFEPLEVSSTDIREELKRGKRPDCISEGVFAIIRNRGLYGFCEGI